MKQKWSRQKCSHTDMLAEELPTRMPTHVTTRIDLVPAIVQPIIFNRETYIFFVCLCICLYRCLLDVTPKNTNIIGTF